MRCRLGLCARRLCTAGRDFGARDGGCIANKRTVLQEVDRALGAARPADLEVILTDHLTCVDSPFNVWMHSHFLRFGHVAVRYTTSDGKQRVMNILGSLDVPGAKMVNFVDPSEYIYGTRGWDSWAQQGGAYNRDFIGVRVERCSPGATDALHKYFEALDARASVGRGGKAGAARFQLIEARLSELARHLPAPLTQLVHSGLERARGVTEMLAKGTPSSDGAVLRAHATMTEARDATYTAGNCAQWTSSGIAFAGLLRRSRMFPKSILIELLESEFKHGRAQNAHVVLYKHVAHAPPYLDRYRFLKPAYVHPLHLVRNYVYADMHKFADVVVEVPPGQDTAVVRRIEPSLVARPPGWIPAWRMVVLGAPTVVLVGAVDHIGPIGPVAAAVWLGVSWWLH